MKGPLFLFLTILSLDQFVISPAHAGDPTIPAVIATETGNFPAEIPPYYVDGFELRVRDRHTDLYWWSGQGRCGGEFPSQGKIRLLNVIGGTASMTVADCRAHFGSGDPRSVARDDTYVYFAHPDGVRRQSVHATPSDPTTLLAPANGRQMGALTLAGGRIYWSDYDGTTSRVFSMNPDGSDLRPIFARNYPKIRRLVVGAYRVGLSFTDTLYLLHTDGRLNRFDYKTPGATEVTLATVVFDFDLRDESTGSGLFTERFTSVYVIVSAQTQLRSVRADLPSSSTLVRAATGDIKFTSFTVDARYAFLMEQPSPCAPICIPIGHTLRRQTRPPNNAANAAVWEPITTGSGDTLTRSNLRSDEQYVYWMAGADILRLGTGVAPLELDLVAVALEIVQTTQDLNHSVRLVQGKPTVARAYVRTSRNSANLQPLLPGATLRVRHLETEMGTLSPVNRPVVDATSDLNSVTTANSPATLRFRLIVRDGELTSSPSEVGITLRSVVAQNVPPRSSGHINALTGAFEGELAWPGEPGERALVQATTNFLDWVDLGFNTVDFNRSIPLRDAAAAILPYRFYRALGAPATTQLVYSNDFSGVLAGSEWSGPRPISTTPLGNRRFLGQFTAVTKSLQLNNLPTHTRLVVSFDLFILKSWDGNRLDFGPDTFELAVRGGPLLWRSTFSTYSTQSYPGMPTENFPANSGAEEINTLGYTHPNLGPADAVYHLSLPFDHSGTSVILDFRGVNLQDVSDESWGLDNVQVEAINAP